MSIKEKLNAFTEHVEAEHNKSFKEKWQDGKKYEPYAMLIIAGLVAFGAILSIL